MRMLLKAVLDTEAANEAFRSGAAAEALDQIQEALQPEALYGFVEEGERVSLRSSTWRTRRKFR
jgi:hypothetical protein